MQHVDVPRVKISGEKYGNVHSVTFGGLTKEEHDDVVSLVTGLNWVRIVDGRVQIVSAAQPLPEPQPDGLMTPFWADERGVDSLGDFDFTRKHSVRTITIGDVKSYSPSFIIQHVGAGVTKASDWRSVYKRSTGLLESWSFEIMRSRRGRSGKFWELWFLPFLDGATGALGDFVKTRKESLRERDAAKTLSHDLAERRRRLIEDAIEYIIHSGVSFGSLDVCSQQAALTYD